MRLKAFKFNVVIKSGLFTLLFLIFACTLLYEQNEVKIEGTVVEDGSNISLE